MAKKRKTKEEKIIARLRRELKEIKKELKQLKEERGEKSKKEKPEKEARAPKPLDSNLYPLTSNLYLKRDLTKSLILSILAIGIELVVYWLTIKGFDISNLPAQLKMNLF